MIYRLTSVAALCLAAALLAPTVAQADDSAITPTVEVGPRVEVRTEGTMVWVDAFVPTLESTDMKINLRAPGKRGHRYIWQQCDFQYQGPGRYSCGFTSRDAKKHPGTWAAVLRVDRRALASTTFRVAKAPRR